MESGPRRGETASLGLVVAAARWGRGRDRRGPITAFPGKKGPPEAAARPILESNCGPERGSDLPKVTQGDRAAWGRLSPSQGSGLFLPRSNPWQALANSSAKGQSHVAWPPTPQN